MRQAVQSKQKEIYFLQIIKMGNSLSRDALEPKITFIKQLRQIHGKTADTAWLNTI